jgi:putative membrane protein
MRDLPKRVTIWGAVERRSSMMWGYGSGWGWFMGLGMLLFWGTIIVLVVWAVSKFSRPSFNDPKRILEERFARGEIDEEEFRTRGALLSR